jgi:hypothetical protein
MSVFVSLKAKRANAASQQRLQELFEGLTLYFDAALPLTLLYRSMHRLSAPQTRT